MSVTGWILENLTGALLTYGVYSTLTLAAAFTVTRFGWLADPAHRMLAWKCAALLPLPLTMSAVLLPTPQRVPVIRLNGRTETQEAAHAARLDTRLARRIEVPRQAAGTASRERRSIATGAARSSPRRDAGAEVVRPRRLAAWLPIAVPLFWLVGVVWGGVRLGRELFTLRRLVASSQTWAESRVLGELRALQRALGMRRPLRLLASNRVVSPLAGGVRRPFIVVPACWFERLDERAQRAILAHEAAHVLRRDPLWNLILQLNHVLFFFQPLHHVAWRELRIAAEYLADRDAVRRLESPVDLARSLLEMAERLRALGDSTPAGPPLATPMASRTGDLGHRVTTMLQAPPRHVDTRRRTRIVAATILGGSLLLILTAPRVQAGPSLSTSKTSQEPVSMRSIVPTLALFAGLMASPELSSDAKAQESKRVEAGGSEAVAVPEELRRFSGMMIGKLVDRDLERGSFTVTVDYVARVWENNRAPQPRAAIGKTLRVEGVTGKWLDQLLLIRPGETVEFEAQHREGDALRFPGEWLKKTTPFDPEQYPVPPEGFRGFAGMVRGTIEAKREESRELVLKVEAIEQTFPRNRAEKPESIVGKRIVLAGFWARMSKPFDPLRAGDSIRAGVLHRVPQSDHFTVIELAEKVPASESAEAPDSPKAPVEEDGKAAIPAGMRGFRGILRGTLVSRDVEKGELVFTAERATRVWKQNRATNTASCRGKNFLVKGIAGKWLDVLLTLNEGDTIEVEAFHNGEAHLDFISEWLKKVE